MLQEQIAGTQQEHEVILYRHVGWVLSYGKREAGFFPISVCFLFPPPLSLPISFPDSLASLSDGSASSLLSPSSVKAYFDFLFTTFFGDILKTMDAINRRLNLYILLRSVRTACVVKAEHVLAP